MDEDAVPLLNRAATPVQWLRVTSKRSTLRRMLTSPVFYALVLLATVLPILMRHTSTIQDLSIAYARPRPRPVPQFKAHGNSQCLPPVTESLIEHSLRKHATCRKYAPFTTGGPRIATVTAHFGKDVEAYRPAFQTHLLHSLIHGTEVRVMCDAVVDDLWNKPAFILNLLMEEMLKPVHERLEWIMWVDRDTMILDQCRPMTSFLPPKRSVTKAWWLHARGKSVEKATSRHSNATEVNLLVTSDFNGLNNGVFIVRVNEWAVSLFTDVLAFRYYRPDVDLPFTEQTAMAHVIETDPFRDQTKYVPQHWFNAYSQGRARDFQDRKVIGPEVADASARKGDFLVHFAGVLGREQVIEEYAEMLEALGDVWEEKTVQRDSSEDILKFWKDLGYVG